MASVPHCLRANKQICSDCSIEPAGLSAIIHVSIQQGFIRDVKGLIKKDEGGVLAREPKTKSLVYLWDTVSDIPAQKDIYIIDDKAAQAASDT